MRPELKRIEAALEAASHQYLPSSPPSTPAENRKILLPVSESATSDSLPVALPPGQLVLAVTHSALTVSLLAELQTQVQTWISDLQELLQQIQAIYDEGPIVAGWLESVNPEDPNQTSYRLCGLDADGHIWYRPCPHEQLPDVSLAIVRYQRLQALLSRKQKLETLLGQLTDSLVDIHKRLADRAE